MSDQEYSILPSLDENGLALISYRVLVSAKEAGCLIGQNGSVIDSIREETNTSAGVSKLQLGSHERILTVSGALDDAARALSYFAQALVNAAAAAGPENQFSYSYFPLKQLLQIANIPGETTILRLLVPNAQMGSIIGARGARIREIQNECNVLMIASNSFLPDSNERLVELQGTVDNFYDALRIILRCLLEESSSAVGTSYYSPHGSAPREDQLSRTTLKLPFPNDVVGALIGKNGSRILGVRKVSGATIAISEVNDDEERIFTITGTQRAIDKAKSLLYHNLEREQERRSHQELERDDNDEMLR